MQLIQIIKLIGCAVCLSECDSSKNYKRKKGNYEK